MIDKITNAARALLPPNSDEDPRGWRITMFFSTMTLWAIVSFHQLAAYGYLESWGIARVASQSEVERIDARSKSILYAIYAPQIRAKVRQRCDTTDPEMRERINKELDRLLKEYKAGADADFTPMPTCDEV